MMSLWFNLENKWSKKKITTYCILCLSLGQAGQSNPLQNSEWRPSTWSQCYHILYIQSGNLSANNHKNKPLLEPVLTGDLSFLYHPKWPPSLLPNSSLSWTLPPSHPHQQVINQNRTTQCRESTEGLVARGHSTPSLLPAKKLTAHFPCLL